MSNTNVTIHDSVKDYYTQRVTESSSCCGDGGGSCGTYDDAVLENLPPDIAELSLGCGDPVTLAGLQAGETVLDLGSGAGMDCFLAAQRVGEEGHVIGVDMTPAMLDKANANKARLGVHNVEFRAGHIEALPVEDNAIDIIMSNCVINLSPQKADVFAEAFRVLRPGGRLAISDIVTDRPFTDEQRADADSWSACVSGAIPAQEYTALMEQAGFVDVRVVDKVSTEVITSQSDAMPRLYSARITARKPQ